MNTKIEKSNKIANFLLKMAMLFTFIAGSNIFMTTDRGLTLIPSIFFGLIGMTLAIIIHNDLYIERNKQPSNIKEKNESNIKQNTLNNDDFYEIEKMLDVQAGWINDKLNQYCTTAINSAFIEKKGVKYEKILNRSINSLVNSRDKIKSIRNKLESIRKADNNGTQN